MCFQVLADYIKLLTLAVLALAVDIIEIFWTFVGTGVKPNDWLGSKRVEGVLSSDMFEEFALFSLFVSVNQ